MSTVMNTSTSDYPTRWEKLPGSGVSSVAACDARILQRWQQQEPECNKCQQQAPKNSGHIAIFGAFYPVCAFLSCMVMLLSGNPLDSNPTPHTPKPKTQNLKHETSNIKLKPLSGDYKGAFNVGQSITPNGIIISGVNSSRVFLSCEGSARGLAFLGDGTGSHAEVRDLTIRDCVGDYGRAHCMQHTRTVAHTCHRSGYFVCPFNCSSETCGA